jgi:uncharacterized protein YgiM (DUF1202 family)
MAPKIGKRRILFLLVILGCSLPGLCFSETTAKAIRDIPVRIDSTILSQEIGRIKEGTYLQIIDENYDWYRIVLPEYIPGYVHSDYIDTSKDTLTGISKVNNLNIRNRPTLDSDVIGELNKGQKVTIQDRQSEWLKIQANPYSRGWIHNRYVELNPETKKTEQVRIPKPEIKPKEQEKIKEFQAVKKTEQPLNQTKPLATGILVQTQDIFGKDSYKLQNENGAITLNPAQSQLPKDYINKRVSIWGQLEKEKNNYYLKVTHIELKNQ